MKTAICVFASLMALCLCCAFFTSQKSEEGVDEDGSDASEGYQPSESAEEEEDASEEDDGDDDSDASVVDRWVCGCGCGCG